MRQSLASGCLQGWSEERIHRSAICVVGPPGAGKTTLVASWLDARLLPGIWYQIDPGDTDLATFFYYVGQAALRFTRKKQRPLPLLTPEYLSDVEGFARRFFRELFSRLSEGATLVLDNYQEVASDQQFHLIIAEAVAETPAGTTLIIVSRRDPPDCYARLVANENVALIDWEDLKLTFEEALAIGSRKVELDRERIAHLHKQSDGWAAGFVLLLERLRHGESLLQPQEPESLRSVFNYFAGQLFDQTPAEGQRLLLHLSFLPLIAESAAREVAGNGAMAVLEDLHRRHLFIDRRRAGEPVYQFHALFRAFLQHRAAHTMTLIEQTEISQRAARALELSDHPADAFALHLKTADLQAAENIILREAARLIGQGRWKVVVGWIGSLPPERVNTRSWLTHWLGTAEIAVEPIEARKILEKSYELAVSANDALCQVQAAAGIIQTYMLQYTHFKPLDRWIGALEHRLSAQIVFPNVDTELRAQSALLIALAYRQPWHPALASCVERVFELVHTGADTNLRVIGAAYLLAYGATTGPTSLSRRTLPVLKALLLHPDVTALNAAWAWFLISFFYCLSGNFDQSHDAATKIERISNEHGLPHALKFANIISAWRELFRVDPRAAWKWIERITPLEVSNQLYDRATYYVTIGWYYILIGQPAKGLEHYEQGIPLFDEAGSVMHRVMYRFYMAFALTLCKRADVALQSVAEARRIAGASVTTWQACALYAAEAYAALEEGDRVGALEVLNNRFSFGRVHGEEYGYVHALSPFMPHLCAVALKEGIEVEHVRGLVRQHGWEAPAEVPDNWPWALKIHTLGEFRVLIDDKTLTFGHKTPRKPLALLKALIALGGTSVPEQKLIDALWPEEEGDAARSAYKVALHRLRNLLEEQATLIIEGGTISLNAKLCW